MHVFEDTVQPHSEHFLKPVGFFFSRPERENRSHPCKLKYSPNESTNSHGAKEQEKRTDVLIDIEGCSRHKFSNASKEATPPTANIADYFLLLNETSIQSSRQTIKMKSCGRRN